MIIFIIVLLIYLIGVRLSFTKRLDWRYQYTKEELEKYLEEPVTSKELKEALLWPIIILWRILIWLLIQKEDHLGKMIH